MAKTSNFFNFNFKLLIAILLAQHHKVFSESDQFSDTDGGVDVKVDPITLTDTQSQGPTSEPEPRNVDPSKSLVWGPGLKTSFFVPVRYFYIQAVDKRNVR